MAKVSYVLSKSGSGNGKTNFHFDGNVGSGKWFSKIFNNGKEEHSSDPNDITYLLSKLVVDGDYSISRNSETRVEFEGSTEEIKEFATWSINQVKAEAGTLKELAAFLKEYCRAIVDMFKGISGYTEHVEEIQSERDKFEAENLRLTKEMDDLRESLKKTTADKKGNVTDSKNQ